MATSQFKGDQTGLDGMGAQPSAQDGWGPSYGSATRTPTSGWQTSYARAPQPTPGQPATNGFSDQGDYSPSYAGANANGQGAAPNDPIAQDRSARQTYSVLKSAGHDVKWQGSQLMVDGRPYTLGTGAPSPQADPNVDWSAMDPRLAALYQKHGSTPTGTGTGLTDYGYWNGKITGGDSDYFLNRLDADLSGNGMDTGPQSGGGEWNPSFTAAHYDMPTIGDPFGPGGIPTYKPGSSPELDALMSKILTNPSSLDEHAVDSMKAKMKDTLAEQGQFQDQNLKGMGATMGIADSPWLASERSAAQRSTGQAIASGNQNLDIEAAKTRASDQRSAASLGMQQQQLREQVAQAAAQSGQSAKSIMADWIMKNAGLKLNVDQLNNQSQQFLEDLMVRVQQINQQDRQFGADLGYRYGAFNANMANQPPDLSALGFS